MEHLRGVEIDFIDREDGAASFVSIICPRDRQVVAAAAAAPLPHRAGLRLIVWQIEVKTAVGNENAFRGFYPNYVTTIQYQESIRF